MQLVLNTRKGGDAFIRIACLFLVALLPFTAQGQTNINTKINSIDGAAMVYIPAGEFLMGSNERDDSKPPHNVYLDGYWIYKYEVTVAQYRKFCKATRRRMPAAPPWGWKDNHPIVNVSWFDANAYRNWAGVALPTEAQWEKAARGTDGRRYPWGNHWSGSKCANSVGKYNLQGTRPVGSYPQGGTPFGVHEMAGNVWEWCADWYDRNYYKNSPTHNPTGPSSGQMRVVRGASFNVVSAIYFRTAIRNLNAPDLGSFNRGFRCVHGDK